MAETFFILPPTLREGGKNKHLKKNIKPIFGEVNEDDKIKKRSVYQFMTNHTYCAINHMYYEGLHYSHSDVQTYE